MIKLFQFFFLFLILFFILIALKMKSLIEIEHLTSLQGNRKYLSLISLRNLRLMYIYQDTTTRTNVKNSY